MWLHIHLCVLLLRYDVGVLFGTEIRQYWWENNAKFFTVWRQYLSPEDNPDPLSPTPSSHMVGSSSLSAPNFMVDLSVAGKTEQTLKLGLCSID